MHGRILLERFDAPPEPDEDRAVPEADHALPVPAGPVLAAPEEYTEPPPPDPGPTLERIAALLEACLANAVELRRSAERSAAEAFGRAAEAAIPVLAGRGFAEEIAAAARALAASAAPQTIVLTVAAEELEAVSHALDGRGGREAIVLRAGGGMRPGQAEVSWTDGGAEIDVERLTAEALRILEQHLPG